MLIKVFGIWLMASNITSLTPINWESNSAGLDCSIKYTANRRDIIIASCDEVAEEINKQIKGQKQ